MIHKRVYSGMSAILDFQIVNLRSHDCSKESRNTNCQIVELFLTVDTSRKMQNGVNIHISIDRFDDRKFSSQKLWTPYTREFSLNKHNFNLTRLSVM